MTDFNKMLDWKLLAGSHDFPGPDGGTCINEAAIIATGFEYKKVNSWRDCPKCFSPVISAFLIRANDTIPDDLRNELLLPLVTRLAGTADSIEVEIKRVRYIITRIKVEISYLAAATAAAYADTAAYVAAYAAAAAADAAAAAADAADAAAAAAADAADAAANAAAYAAANAAHAAANAAAQKTVWVKAIQILQKAIELGNHSIIEDQCLVNDRLNKAKALANA